MMNEQWILEKAVENSLDLQENCVESAKDYSVEKVSRDVLGLYENLLGYE